MQDNRNPGSLPEDPKRSSGESGQTNSLYVNNLNYQTNDLTELRKLAEKNPSLAEKVVENQERQHRREEVSMRFGIVVAGILAIVIVGAGVSVLISMGFWQAVAFVGVLLGISHVLRSVLKGEFSETSWFGAMLKSKSPED